MSISATVQAVLSIWLIVISCTGVMGNAVSAESQSEISFYSQFAEELSANTKHEIHIKQGTVTLNNGSYYKYKSDTNQFYKFSKFNVGAGDTVVFHDEYPDSLDNIIALVVDTKSSDIQGAIKGELKGHANLFLLNSNGVSFGKDAKVGIGGNLFVSTASKLEFKGGWVFDASTKKNSNLSTAPEKFLFDAVSKNPLQSLTALKPAELASKTTAKIVFIEEWKPRTAESGVLRLSPATGQTSVPVPLFPVGSLNVNLSFSGSSGSSGLTPSPTSAPGSAPSSGSSSTQPSTPGNSQTNSSSPSATGTQGTSSASSTASPDGSGASGGSTTQSTGSQTSGASSKSSSKTSSASVPSGIYSRQFERLTMGEEYCALGEGSRLGLGGRGGLPPKRDDLIVY